MYVCVIPVRNRRGFADHRTRIHCNILLIAYTSSANIYFQTPTTYTSSANIYFQTPTTYTSRTIVYFQTPTTYTSSANIYFQTPTTLLVVQIYTFGLPQPTLKCKYILSDSHNQYNSANIHFWTPTTYTSRTNIYFQNPTTYTSSANIYYKTPTTYTCSAKKSENYEFLYCRLSLVCPRLGGKSGSKHLRSRRKLCNRRFYFKLYFLDRF